MTKVGIKVVCVNPKRQNGNSSWQALIVTGSTQYEEEGELDSLRSNMMPRSQLELSDSPSLDARWTRWTVPDIVNGCHQVVNLSDGDPKCVW